MKKLTTLLIASLFLFSIAGSAAAFSLGGYQGELKFKFSNWEMLNDPSGGTGMYDVNNGDGIEDNYGVFVITSIANAAGIPIWSYGTGGEELTGVFYGIDIQKMASNPDGTTNILAVGGHMDIYLDSNLNFWAQNGTAGYTDPGHTQYNSVTDGNLFLSLDMVAGIDPLSDSTMDGDVDFGTNPSTGDVAYYLEVTGGSHASTFDSNMYSNDYIDDTGATVTQVADFFAQTDFTNKYNVSDWNFTSEDPVRGAAVPIPGAAYLLGTGLIGLAGLRRKYIS